MTPTDPRCSRRDFLASAAGLSLTAGGAARAAAARGAGRSPLGVLGTVYRPLSCLAHLAGRFLHGYPRLPSQYVHTMWLDQVPANDLARDLARAFGFRRARTVHDALAEGRLCVDGVMLVAEHGNYPRNGDGQVLYPRFEMFAQVVAAFHETRSVAPVYVARQLSHDFGRARQMVAWSRELGFPLMAGSPLPFTRRSGDLASAQAPVAEALVAGFGPVEVGGFDALEALQCLVENRHGGETGVAAVTCLSGRDVWRAGDSGRWSWPLLHAALEHSATANLGDVRANAGAMAVAGMPATPPIAILVERTDGTRGTALLLNGHVQDVTAAVTDGESVRAGAFEILPPPGCRHYDRLAGVLEEFFATGRPAAPVERTLLTTGLLTAAMQSHASRGTRVETPHLAFGYSA
jgi:hypothetical protein